MEFKGVFNQLGIREKTILLIPRVKRSSIPQVTFPIPTVFVTCSLVGRFPAKWLLSLKNPLLTKQSLHHIFINKPVTEKKSPCYLHLDTLIAIFNNFTFFNIAYILINIH